jgi:hypothetical protein
MPTRAAIAAFVGSLTADYRAALAKIDKPTRAAGRSVHIDAAVDPGRDVTANQPEILSPLG